MQMMAGEGETSMCGHIPVVSVIIPTCNRAKFVARAIKSVLDQTFNDYEIIVVDDCSDDRTEEVINDLIEKDHRIRYFRHNTRMGGSAARNTGIAHAEGQFMAFLDDDDEWFPQKLQIQIKNIIDRPRIGLIYTGYHYVSEKNKNVINTFCPNKRGFIYDELLETNCVGTTSSVMIRKECFEKVGVFDFSLPACQDWDLWIRISKMFEIDFIDKPLVKFYIHDKRITRNVIAKIKGRQILLNKYYKDIEKDSKNLSLHYFVLGYLICHNGEVSYGRKKIIKAITLYPFNWQYYKYLLLSLLGAFFYNKLLRLKSKINSLTT